MREPASISDKMRPVFRRRKPSFPRALQLPTLSISPVAAFRQSAAVVRRGPEAEKGFRGFYVSVVLALLTTVFQLTCVAAAPNPVRVLILSGQNNHDWRQTTPRLKSILTASGRFLVDVTDHPETCDAQTFARYDVLLSDWNTFGTPTVMNWPDSTRTAFLDFVRNGKGLVVVHAGGSSFYDWPEYQQLTIAWWKMGQTSHGAPHKFTVKFRKHPLTDGMVPFETTDELWVRPGFDPGATVIATGDDQPLVVVTHFGKGRGFTMLLGHSAQFMGTPGFQTLLLRGTEWAATARVTFPPDAGQRAAESAVVKALANYRFGEDRKPVLELEKLAAAASTDRATKERLAHSLGLLLAGDCTVEGKRAALAALSLIGSAAEVPTIARFVADEELGVPARQALEQISEPEAEAALLAALKTTSGDAQLGVINSLAVRHSQRAVARLSTMLKGPNLARASAAVDALAMVGGQDAVAALVRATRTIPAALKPHLSEALLRCADSLMTSGDNRRAGEILKQLTSPDQPQSIRVAAFPMLVAALGAEGQKLLLATLSEKDEVMQTASVRALRVAPDPSLIPSAAEHLEQLPPALQVELVACIGDHGNAQCLPVLVKAGSSLVAEVRQAAYIALGTLGDASVVPALTALATKADQADRKLILNAFVRLRGPEVEAALIHALSTTEVAAQRELIRALVARRVTSAVPTLLEIAAGQETALRSDALNGVGQIGDLAACERLAGLLPADAEGAASAMAEICRREHTIAPMVHALANAGVPARAAILEAFAAVGGREALDAVRAGLNSKDEALRTAAVRAMANWPDGAPLDDLVSLSCTTQEPTLKTLGLRGVARLAPLSSDHSVDARVELISRALRAGGTLNEQKALVAALGEIPDQQSLKALEPFLAEPALAEEAKAAVRHINERRTGSPVPPWTDEILKLFQSSENLCRGATATNLDGLTPDGQGQLAAAAIDGDPATYWDETDNQKLYWLHLELKQPARVGLLRILGYQDHNYAPRDFEVLCDGKSVKKVEGAEYKDNMLTIDVPPTECRALDLKITGYYGQSPAIRELGVFSAKPGK